MISNYLSGSQKSISLEAKTCLRVLEDAVTDHYPLLVQLETKPIVKNKLKSVWRRNISKINAYDFEAQLGLQDWSGIYNTNDPNIILNIILTNVNSALDIVSPMEEIKFRLDKPKLNLRKDTLAAMEVCNKAQRSGNKDLTMHCHSPFVFWSTRKKISKINACAWAKDALIF